MLPCRAGTVWAACPWPGALPVPFATEAAGKEGRKACLLPACRVCIKAQRGAEPFPTTEDGAVPSTVPCCPCSRQQSTLLALIRTRREIGKVQAGVKKAQGGSSCISLTSQEVQPRRSAATGTQGTTTKPNHSDSHRTLPPARLQLCCLFCWGTSNKGVSGLGRRAAAK